MSEERIIIDGEELRLDALTWLTASTVSFMVEGEKYVFSYREENGSLLLVDELNQGKQIPFHSNISHDGYRTLKISSHISKVKAWKEGEEDEELDEWEVKSLLPGTVIEVSVEVGQLVHKGDSLLVLEAMKMEHRLVSPGRAKVKRVFCAKGDGVEEGKVLIELDEEASS